MSYHNLLKLTPFQKTFYYEWQKEPQQNNYNLVMDNILNGNINVNKFESGLLRFVSQYFILSSNIYNFDGEPYWKLTHPSSHFFQYHPEPLSEPDIYKITSKPFNLERGPLLKVHLIKVRDNKYRVIFIVHHIVLDGLSTNEFYNEWPKFYNDDNYSVTPLLDEQIKLYQDLYGNFENIKKNNNNSMNEFWQKYLNNLTGVDLSFLTSKYDHQKNKKIINEFTFSFDEKIFNKVEIIKRNYRITPFILGQITLAMLLYKFTNKNAIGIMYPMALTEGKDLYFGAHVNTLIIRYDFNENTTLQELIDISTNYYKEVISTKAKYLPIYEITQYLSDKSVLDVGFVHSFFADHAIKINNVVHDKICYESQIDLFGKIVFEQEQYNNKLQYRVRYRNDILDEDLVNNFIAIYKKLFSEILQDLADGNSNQKIYLYNILDQQNYNKIITNWNLTDKQLPLDKKIHQLFEQQVKRTPNSLAAFYKEQTLTYQELNEKANQLANYLIKSYNIQPDECISILLDRSQFTLIAILAVLKSGAAYVPISPQVPTERLDYILIDTASEIILIDSINYEKITKRINLGKINIEIINTDHFAEKIKTQSISNPQTKTTSSNLAYVIYTSGTTGIPKGVMIEHKGVINVALNTREHLSNNTTKRVMWHSNYTFDAHVTDIFPTLTNGHCLFVVEEELRADIILLKEYIINNKIEFAFLPPILVDTNIILPLKILEVGGESTSMNIMESYTEAGIQVINAYGPTEITVISNLSYYQSNKSNLTIGKPIANTKCYILDKNMNPVPLGVIGDLYISSIGLARGYLNNHSLTEEKFIKNPFEPNSPYYSKMYKTGDLARYLNSGEIEYCGRSDFQIKIRGFRVELGDIEASLSSYLYIQKAIVQLKENDAGIKYLVAYYTSSTNEDIASDVLKTYLHEKLPDYMIPSIFIRLDHIPTTPNGKINLSTLPSPKFTSKQYQAPTNENEKTLCKLFAEVLKMDVISIDDNFFELGGHSLLATQLMSKMRSHFNVDISMKSLFDAPTISQLSNLLDSNPCSENALDVLLPLQKNGQLPAIFCIHPGGGIGWSYAGLIPYIESNRPLYALQARSLSTGKLACSVDEMAKDYLAYIRTIQPKGPYLLIGWSFGCHIAQKIATLLQEEKETISLLVFIDAYPWKKDLPLPSEMEIFHKFANEFLKQKSYQIESFDDILQNLKEEMHPLANFDDAIIKRVFNEYQNVPNLLQQFKPDTLNCSLLFFQAQVQENITKPHQWSKYITGDINIHALAFTHERMLDKNALEYIGPMINSHLNKMENKS